VVAQIINSAKTETKKMETSFKSITNVQSWRLAAIALGGALAMTLATTAFAVKPNITSPTTATGQVGVSYTVSSPLYQITASQPPILSYSTTVSVPGVTFSTTTGKFTGTPTTAGPFSGTITATNATGPSNPQNLTVTINPPTPVVTSATATGQAGVSYTALSPLYQITATNSPTSYGASGLPAGLNVNTTTGAITGTPTTAVNNVAVTISATNAGGTGTGTLTVTINPPAPTVTSAGTATGQVGVSYTASSPLYQIQANQTIPSGGWGTTVSIPGVNFDATTGKFTGTPTTAGPFSGTITATNANGTGAKALAVTISPPPHTDPTAMASISPQTPPGVYTGDTVTLDSTGSHTNPPGGTLTYTWQQPPGQTISISHQGDPIPTFFAPAPPVGQDSQVVTFTLKVKDADFPSLNDTSAPVTATVYALPTANAGTDQNVDQGTTVYLIGSGSTGVSLTYAWTAPAGIDLSDPTAVNPTFTAPPFTPPNGMSYTFTLVVTEHRDGFPPKVSHGDQVVIMVKQPPIAYASAVDPMDNPNNVAPEGNANESSCTALTNVTLYGFGTDPDTDVLTFNWKQVRDTGGTDPQQGDTMVALSDNTSNRPTFTAPDLPNGTQQVDLVFQLTVNDGTINSAASYVTIHVLNTNDPPVAMASASPTPAPVGSTVTLDGSASTDPNLDQGDSLTYTWTQIGGTPTVTLSDAHAVMPTFTAPQPTMLSFMLTVTDRSGCSTQANVDVNVIENNHPPVAQAGSDQNVAEGNTFCLDGSGSFDPDAGDTLTYTWTQIDGPTVTLDHTIPSNPCFATPNVGVGGATLHFHLVVIDNHGASSTDNPQSVPDVAVNVTYVNQPPTAKAGDDQTVDEMTTVHLDGSQSSDPDGNSLTYSWEQVGGLASVGNLTEADTATPTFTAPRVTCAGDVVVMRLTVDDGQGGTDSKNVNINVANTNLPTANAGDNQPGPGDPPVKEGDAVSLRGSGSDADPEEVSLLTFQWNQTSGSPVVALSPSSGKDVSFTAPSIPFGDPNASLDLGFSLTVTDSCGGSTTTSPETVHVANIPHAPVAKVTGPANANEGGDNVQLDGSMSSDPDLDPITYIWEQTAGTQVNLVFGPGDTGHQMPMFVTPWVSANTDLTFKLTVTDPYGLTNSASITVTIVNWHTPPDITGARAGVGVLWPPDHKMAQVTIVGVIKPSDDKIAITTVTQDEPTNGLGDGDTAIDAVKQVNASGDDSVLLRAERSGKGDGRVYRVSFKIDDPEASATGMVKVSVPHDKKTDAAIDSGGNYDSTH
jgi:hypothetical protein